MRRLTLGICVAAVCLLARNELLAESCPDAIRGGWESSFPAKALFGIALVIQKKPDDTYTARVNTAGGGEDLAVWPDARSLRLQSVKFPLSFEGRPSADGDRIDGFIDYASNLYRVTLGADGPNRWSTTWTPIPLVADAITLDLYFDDDGEGGTGGYFFFRDERMPSLYGLGASCSHRQVEVAEKNLGLTFRGEFDDAYSRLEMTVAGPGSNATVVFTPLSAERLAMPPGESESAAREPNQSAYAGQAPETVSDGWRTARPSDLDVGIEPLVEMVDAVVHGELPKTHAILVAKSGYLIVEEYFYGFDRRMLHDMRSASKSLASALIGLAVDRDLIDGADARVLSFFPEYRSYKAWDPRKAEITIRDLMTMSSGLDANDSDRKSAAAEGAFQSQSAQPDWIRLALDAPMIADPGARLIYGSANPLILGGILANVVGDRVEWFAEAALFGPLGIDRYRIYMDPTGVPYMGGGIYLRPRDMLKIGQLYLDGGRWQGRQVLSESWVRDSFGKYGRLEPLDRNGNEYGYLWWHESYQVGGRKIASVEARGNGGQYIFVVPGLEAVAVITSGNYRGGLTMTRQPQRIFERYLLPALVH